ncbi:hypothetical protein OROMI_023126 [Orobanche minor]
MEGYGEVGGTEQVNKGTEEVHKGAGVVKGTKEVKGTNEVKGVNEYEKLRNKNVEESRQKLDELGLKRHPGKAAEKRPAKKPDSSKAFSNKESDNYDPKNDLDQLSDIDEDIATSKRKKKSKGAVLGSGPRTHSRASRITLPPTVKQVNEAGEVEVGQVVEANDDTPKVSTANTLKLIRKNPPGSIAANLELREREKAAMETLQSQSQTDNLQTQTEDKYVISEDCYDWVMMTMRDLFRGHKSRIKRNHYYRYPTDEERLQNRPWEVPLKEFKMLLEYWTDEKITKRANTNAESRSRQTETHTAGSKSFVQVCHNMAIERALLDTPEEAPVPISDADVYVKTRQRKSEREYKLPTDEVVKKIENVEKLLKEGTVEEANEVVYGGKDHSRSFLVERLIKKREPKKISARPIATIPIPDKYVTSLIEKIRDQIVKEMEEQVEKKVQDNIKLMISKLAEKNPNLNLGIEELTSAAHTTVEPSEANVGNDSP